MYNVREHLGNYFQCMNFSGDTTTDPSKCTQSEGGGGGGGYIQRGGDYTSKIIAQPFKSFIIFLFVW